jgi:uncharacterized membrane protein
MEKFTSPNHPTYSAEYAADFTGKVKIRFESGTVNLSCAFLLELVAEQIRVRKIAQIAQMSTEELLGISIP